MVAFLWQVSKQLSNKNNGLPTTRAAQEHAELFLVRFFNVLIDITNPIGFVERFFFLTIIVSNEVDNSSGL